MHFSYFLVGWWNQQVGYGAAIAPVLLILNFLFMVQWKVDTGRDDLCSQAGGCECTALFNCTFDASHGPNEGKLNTPRAMGTLRVVSAIVAALTAYGMVSDASNPTPQCTFNLKAPTPPPSPSPIVPYAFGNPCADINGQNGCAPGDQVTKFAVGKILYEACSPSCTVAPTPALPTPAPNPQPTPSPTPALPSPTPLTPTPVPAGSCPSVEQAGVSAQPWCAPTITAVRQCLLQCTSNDQCPNFATCVEWDAGEPHVCLAVCPTPPRSRSRIETKTTRSTEDFQAFNWTTLNSWYW